ALAGPARPHRDDAAVGHGRGPGPDRGHGRLDHAAAAGRGRWDGRDRDGRWVGRRDAAVDRLAIGGCGVRVVVGHRVHLGAAGDRLGRAVTRPDDVHPRAAVEAVGAGAAVQRVVAAEPDERVVPVVPNQRVVAVVAGQHVVARAADDLLDPAADVVAL